MPDGNIPDPVTVAIVVVPAGPDAGLGAPTVTPEVPVKESEPDVQPETVFLTANVTREELQPATLGVIVSVSD